MPTRVVSASGIAGFGRKRPNKTLLYPYGYSSVALTMAERLPRMNWGLQN
jgi:hypothetical protein